jgi:hypothetical protein
MDHDRELGSAMRFPEAPEASSQAAIEAAWPRQIVVTAGRT